MTEALPTVRLYLEIARRGYRRHAAYKGAAWGGVFTNTIFGFMRAAVYTALLASAGTIGGWDLTDTLTYTFVTQGMLMMVYLWGWKDIAESIRSGDVVTDLYRPYDYQLYWLAQDLGRATFHALYRGIPPFVVGALVFDLRLPTSPFTWLAFLVSCALAVCAAFGIRFMMNLTAFWLLDWGGLNGLVQAFWTALSGVVIPVVFFPPVLREIGRFLPFASTVQIPVETFLGLHGPGGLAGALLLQAAWAIALLLAGRVVLARAVRKVVVQGG